MGQDGELDIVLVGRQLVDNENLGIGYLLAAARQAELRAEMLILNGWADLNRVASEINRRNPPLVGLAFPDGGSAPLPLSLGELLRATGYGGHITAGGPFATLARGWLLDRYGWLDSVVRYAGEVPLVGLARCLRDGTTSLTTVPGLTTRQGDGTAAAVLDPSPLELFPEHGELPEVLGQPMVHAVATRGCRGRCAYCGPATLQQQEREEGRRAGHDRMTLTGAGVGGQRRRSVQSICDEMAQLWHESGVRYFYFVDEHLLPRRQDAALAMLGAWQQELKRRGVGALGIGCMLRSDLVTPPILESFAELGLVRTFLGVELATADEHRQFGRGGRLDRGLNALDTLQQLGVAASCNLMLVHPYSTTRSVIAGLETLSAMGAHGVEATQMQIYHGTKLHEQIAREGRVTGNPLQYGYRFLDPVVERFAAAFTRLRFDAFGDYSLTCRHHDAALAVTLAKRLHPDLPLTDLAARLKAASAASNQLRIACYTEALTLAEQERNGDAITQLIDRAHQATAPIAADLTAITSDVLHRIAQPARPFAPMRSAAVGLLGFCLAGASLAACQGPSPVGPPPPASVDLATAPSTPAPGPAPSPADTNPPAALPASTSQPSSSVGCSEARQDELKQKVATIVAGIDTCATRTVLFGWGFKDGPISIRSREGSEQRNAANDERIKKALQQQLTQEERQCLIEQSVFVPREGTQTAQRDKLLHTFEKSCIRRAGSHGPAVLVEVDRHGKAVNIRAADRNKRLSPPVHACIVRALKGLTFPCLTGEEVTRWDPHPVIME
ncbi:MAG: hypothetical protein DRI90_15115 [Deltaproteobacteria bacterium]|nr:MAG: hypothetical protein DRI90_15115 [Deltaproteobacteria bacterium]